MEPSPFLKGFLDSPHSVVEYDELDPDFRLSFSLNGHFTVIYTHDYQCAKKRNNKLRITQLALGIFTGIIWASFFIPSLCKIPMLNVLTFSLSSKVLMNITKPNLEDDLKIRKYQDFIMMRTIQDGLLHQTPWQGMVPVGETYKAISIISLKNFLSRKEASDKYLMYLLISDLVKNRYFDSMNVLTKQFLVDIASGARVSKPR